MNQEIVGKKPISFRDKLKIAGSLFLIVAFISNIFYQNHLAHEAHLRKINLYQGLVSAYNSKGAECEKFDDIPKIEYLNNPRSKERINSVILHYSAISEAKCFINSAGDISNNPYKGLLNAKLPNSLPGTAGAELWQGFLYDLDMGMPFLRTGGSICADNTFSPSVGRGTCSWHGGYGAHRGEIFKQSRVRAIYDPRKVLERLLKE